MSAFARWRRGARAPSWIAVVAILLAGCAAPPPAPRPQVQTPAPAPAPATSVDEARRYLQAGPDPYATFREAKRYRTAGNKEAVFLLVKYAARNGVPEAEHEMGRYYDPATYREGGIVRNPQAPRAADWYGRAAGKDHAPSMVRLGQMYGDGLIKAPSGTNAMEESLRLLNKAAEMGRRQQAGGQVRSASAGQQQGSTQSRAVGIGSAGNANPSAAAAATQGGNFAGNCDRAGEEAQRALERIEKRSHPLHPANRHACEGINNAVVAIWANRECLRDPKYSNSERIQIRAQIEAWEDNLSQWETTYEKLSSIGASCPCLADTDEDICNQGIRNFEHQSRAIEQQAPAISRQQPQTKQQTHAGQGAQDCPPSHWRLNNRNRTWALNERGECECVPTAVDPCVASE